MQKEDLQDGQGKCNQNSGIKFDVGQSELLSNVWGDACVLILFVLLSIIAKHMLQLLTCAS